MYGDKPRRFKFKLPDDSLPFTLSLYYDTLPINKVPVLHIVEEAT